MWTEQQVAGLEEKYKQAVWRQNDLEKRVSGALKDLATFCTKIGETQRANDGALQNIHRELAELAAAANQQELTALLAEPDREAQAGKAAKKRSKKSSGRALTHAPADDLRGAVERARDRGNRFNASRIKEWVKELEQALNVGQDAMINRGLEGLRKELAK